MKRNQIYILLAVLALGLAILITQKTSAQPIIQRTNPESKTIQSIKPEPNHPERKATKQDVQPTKPTQPTMSVKKPKTQKPHNKGVTCPKGTTPSGGGGCLIIPTGCPYGDSIPMDECHE